MKNEASTTLKNKMKNSEVKYQVVLPWNLRSNNAESYIQKFKNHFISVLCSVGTDFHLQLWDVGHNNIQTHETATANMDAHGSTYTDTHGST